MRETEFWGRMERHLGQAYARVWAEQTSLADLDSRTVLQAAEAGVSYKVIWRAVWAALELPRTEW